MFGNDERRLEAAYRANVFASYRSLSRDEYVPRLLPSMIGPKSAETSGSKARLFSLP
jgi:hypothetical protein